MKALVILTGFGVLSGFHPAACAPCIPVEGERIMVSDFAPAAPSLSAMSGQVFGYSPLPGVIRVVKAAEILAMLKRLGLSPAGPVQDVCFVTEAEPLTVDRIRTAILAEMRLTVTGMAVIEYSLAPLPKGRLEFPLEGLGRRDAASPEGAVLWRGRLVTESGKRYAVWARVAITVKTEAVAAKAVFAAGHVLAPEDLLLIDQARFPLAPDVVRSPGDAAGMALKNEVRPDEPLRASCLEAPLEVLPGDMVRVEAVSGGAQIRFDARAETSGRRGQWILLRNPGNGRAFRARVVASGKAEVHVAAGGIL